MLSLEQMTADFRLEPHKEYRLLVGFEYEVLLFSADTLLPLGYEGAHGLGEILRFVATHLGGTLVPGRPPNKVQLPGGALISLEPGGQFEYSSAPVPTFGECLTQLHTFLRLVDEICSRFAVHAFYGGANPVHRVDQIGLVVPNERYRIMDAYFPTTGESGRRMMRQTTSIQVTFDFRTPEIGAQLFRTALYVAPFAAAIFANAPFIDGEHSGHRSERGKIWQDTDPARCGTLPGFTRGDYGFTDYVQHIIRAPMFFVDSPEGVLPANGMTFEQFNKEGFQGRAATLEDFQLHNSTIFADARLKRTVEVRSVDGQSPQLMPAVLAFLSGLLLCNEMRPRTLERLGKLPIKDFNALSAKLAREGLSGEVVPGLPTRELALELLQSARDGVATCYPDGPEALPYLEPIADLIEAGKTPADVVLERHPDARSWLSAGAGDTKGLRGLDSKAAGRAQATRV
ncbi:MAG: hypothetical protein JRH20_12095 [Deltaproteobacteria bacterium]|nr:hypothetical protein [Deltaproteobacteria bacterium]